MMKYLDHLEEWIITFLIGAATLIIFVAVAPPLRSPACRSPACRTGC